MLMLLAPDTIRRLFGADVTILNIINLSLFIILSGLHGIAKKDQLVNLTDATNELFAIMMGVVIFLYVIVVFFSFYN
ncbi:hypothetical protein H1S01_18895 [Heliobacterium chlorum]|uniref:Uncharacterized protein n=1 Tax=Heliobacterium chlorum TaxID=2698 RepID=A0ABR7T7C8_HELCL|nr:hypothetical protein [Heliobacterium chlorum]MBC9786526.1 hypothetical protein [Heliobacterium chlorum]